MAHLCVGDDNCSYSMVIKSMSTAKNFEDITNEWRKIATVLSISKSVENRIDRNIKYETSFTATAIILEILRSWRGSKSKAATLKVLLDALDKCDLKEISKNLRAEFKIPEPIETAENILDSQTEVHPLTGQRDTVNIPYGPPPPYEQFAASRAQTDSFQQNVVDGRFFVDAIENIIKKRKIPEEDLSELRNDEESSITSTKHPTSQSLPQESMLGKCRSAWLKYVERECQKTARDPHTNKKVAAWLFLMLIACYYVHASDAQVIKCDPCVKWSIQFCGKAGAISAGCLGMFPNVLCATVLTAGSSLCAGAAGTCTYYCMRDVWTQGIPTE